jgi:hypothetical protein
MKRSSLISGGTRFWVVVGILLSFPIGCAGGEDEHPATYQYQATPATPVNSADRCATPNEGCPCDTPGEVVNCGKVLVKVDNYETCYEGSRICTNEAAWGPCVPDQSVVRPSR